MQEILKKSGKQVKHTNCKVRAGMTHMTPEPIEQII